MVTREADTANTGFPFYFVVASLDGQKLPGLQIGQLFVNFSEYPDGPTGVELAKLTCGLQGKPLSAEAVRSLAAFGSSMKAEPVKLRAMAKAGLYDRILASIQSDEPAYTTSATLSGVAIDLLIRGKQIPAALQAVELALTRFPNSIRLRQLQGLAFRRAGQLDEAAYRLNLLLEQGHRDTETLGILAAVWADLWEQRKKTNDAASARDALEISRNLYAEGFQKVPNDTYTGINAASKSALLGEMDKANALADQVLAQLKAMESQRGGGPAADYWERVTEPEALLIKGEWARSLELYHAARVAHQNETGSIESTAAQLARLLGVLDAPGDVKQKLAAEFNLMLAR
jgi:hypothetical protein